MEGVVGGEGAGDVVLLDGVGEFLVGLPQMVDVVGGQVGNSGADGEFVE